MLGGLADLASHLDVCRGLDGHIEGFGNFDDPWDPFLPGPDGILRSLSRPPRASHSPTDTRYALKAKTRPVELSSFHNNSGLRGSIYRLPVDSVDELRG